MEEDPELDTELEIKNPDIISMLLFTKNNHTSSTGVSVNKTFCDSSSRTESLRRSVRQARQVKQIKSPDLNLIQHTLRLVRNVGGIPKKCLHLPSS